MFLKKGFFCAFLLFSPIFLSASQPPLIPSTVTATVRLESTPSVFNFTLNIPAAEKLSNAISTIPPLTYTIGVMGLGAAFVYCGWKQAQKKELYEQIAGYLLMAAGAGLVICSPQITRWLHPLPTLV